MTGVRLNPADFDAKRLKEAYASKSQMVRDTDDGLRYLVPDPDKPEERLVENKLTRKSLIGVVGAFYQRLERLPLPPSRPPVLQLRHVGEEQAALRASSSARCSSPTTRTPRFLGTHFDLGVDVFGVAIPFNETEYRDGIEVKSGSVKHLPEYLSLNIGHPLGPYLKASLGIFSAVRRLQGRPTTRRPRSSCRSTPSPSARGCG